MNLGDRVKISDWQAYTQWVKAQNDWTTARLEKAVGTLTDLREDGTAAINYHGFYLARIPRQWVEVVTDEPDPNRLKTQPCPACGGIANRIGLHMQTMLRQAVTVATYHCPTCDQKWQKVLTHDEVYIVCEEPDQTTSED